MKHSVDDILLQFNNKIRLSDFLSKYINLKQKGNEFVACCPFHNEKTPSFNVNDEDGYYHCFGCWAHGDSISFIRNYENKSFIEAIQIISDITGIKIPTNNTESIEVFNERKTLVKIIDLTTKFYCKNLLSTNGKEALSYIKSRGLNELTIKSFKIGYAPQVGLKEYLTQHGLMKE